MSSGKIYRAKRKGGKEERQKKFLETKGYDVEKVISSGQYHVVKQARSVKNNTDVAIKIVEKLEGTPFPYLQRLLQREWKALKDCQHKNVVKFIEIINTDTTVYLVMGIAQNGPLKAFIDESESRRVKEGQARVWFAQLLDAIEHCHLSGWAHRNINVNDIFVDSNQNLKLGGFCYATPIVQINSIIQPSESFAVLRAYASPEILQRKPYDAVKYDVWCAGIVLYVMVMGCYPYVTEDQSDKEILAQMNRPLEFPETDFEVSNKFKSLVKMTLTKVNRRLNIREIKKSMFMESFYARQK